MELKPYKPDFSVITEEVVSATKIRQKEMAEKYKDARESERRKEDIAKEVLALAVSTKPIKVGLESLTNDVAALVKEVVDEAKNEQEIVQKLDLVLPKVETKTKIKNGQVITEIHYNKIVDKAVRLYQQNQIA